MIQRGGSFQCYGAKRIIACCAEATQTQSEGVKRMNWYNDYRNYSVHPGQQPVRVLIGNIIHAFENVYKDFKLEARNFYTDFGLENGIPYIIGPFSLTAQIQAGDMTPYAESTKTGTSQIILSETFFSYLWGVTYCLLVYFHELMYKPSRTKTYQNTDYNALMGASMLFNYAYSLIWNYSTWNKKVLPNPEYYNDINKQFVGITNHAFTMATTLVLCHETSHVIRGHLSPADTRPVIDFELEADESAFDMIIKGIHDEESKLNAAIGTIACLCGLVFFGSTMEGHDHPDTDDRIMRFMTKLTLDDNEALWGIPCIAYRLWDIINNKNFQYGSGGGTYKSLVEDLRAQERMSR